MTPEPPDAPEAQWDEAEDKARAVAQASALRGQARAGGLHFDAYLPPRLAEWVLSHIEQGHFRSPSEAVFVILGEHEELEPHRDLRDELLKRCLQAAMDDPRPPVPAEEAMQRLEELFAQPRPEPATWRKE